MCSLLLSCWYFILFKLKIQPVRTFSIVLDNTYICVVFRFFFNPLYIVLLGFINVGCGLPPRESPYNALPTGLSYTSDIGLVNTGKTGRIAKELEPNYTKPLTTLRYFPDGVRNCYTLNVTRDTKYLIMAKFVYGNYDGLKTDPNFDLYFGSNIWTTVSKNDTREEIIHVTKSNSLQVCLVKTGTSIPFINILELRPLRSTAYVTQSGSLKYLFRVYLSNSRLGIRYEMIQTFHVTQNISVLILCIN